MHDIATDYACRRHAFGKPLIDHEGVECMLADNELDLNQHVESGSDGRYRPRH